jgi:hypothetical protein
VALAGSDHLEGVRWRDRLTGTIENRDIRHVFAIPRREPRGRAGLLVR